MRHHRNRHSFDTFRLDTDPDVPPVVRRNLPGPGHAALKPLEGKWRVEHSIYIVLGTPDKPAVSTDIIRRDSSVSRMRLLL